MGSKIGVGVYAYNQAVMDALVKGQFSPIMLTDPPPEFYLELRRRMPNAFIFLRRWVDGQLQAEALNHPLRAAQEYSEHVLDLALRLPGISATTSYNEVACDADSMRHYDMFQVDFISEVQIRHGIPVVCANFGLGNPQVADALNPYDAHNDMLLAMKSTWMAKYVGVHLYSEFGQPLDGANKEWYGLRYRFVHRAAQLLRPKQQPLVFIATESGPNQPWNPGIAAPEVARQYEWLNQQFDADNATTGGPRVLGQCAFGLWGDGQWGGFDWMGTQMIDLIATYNQSKS